MAGFYPVDHGDMDHPVFGVQRRPYTRWEAYCWLLDHAAFDHQTTTFHRKPVVLDRGQVAISLGELARTWKWTRASVQRFIKGLISANFLAYSPISVASTISDTSPDTAADTPVSILTLCKYGILSKNMAAADTATDTPRETPSDTLTQTTPYVLSLNKEESNKRRKGSKGRGIHPMGESATQPDLLGGQVIQMPPSEVQIAFDAYQRVARDLGLAVPVDIDKPISGNRGAPSRQVALRERLTERLGPESKRLPGLEGWMFALATLREAKFITSGGWKGFSLDDMVTREKLESLMAGRYNNLWKGGTVETTAERDMRDYYEQHPGESFFHQISPTGKVKV